MNECCVPAPRRTSMIDRNEAEWIPSEVAVYHDATPCVSASRPRRGW